MPSPETRVEEIIANMPKIKCATCNGEGWDVQADSYGEPEQVQCQDCHAEGMYTTLDCVRTVITQVLANHAKELVRLVEDKKVQPKTIYYDDMLTDAHNKALDKAISIINSSGISIE